MHLNAVLHSAWLLAYLLSGTSALIVLGSGLSLGYHIIIVQPWLIFPRSITTRALYKSLPGARVHEDVLGKHSGALLPSLWVQPSPFFPYTQDQRTETAPARHQASVALLEVYVSVV